MNICENNQGRRWVTKMYRRVRRNEDTNFQGILEYRTAYTDYKLLTLTFTRGHAI